MRVRQLREDVDLEVIVQLYILVIETDVSLTLDGLHILAQDWKKGRVCNFTRILAKHERAHLQGLGELLDHVWRGAFDSESSLIISSSATAHLITLTNVVSHVAERLAFGVNHNRVLFWDRLIDNDHVFVCHILIGQAPNSPIRDLFDVTKDLFQAEIVGLLNLILSV